MRAIPLLVLLCLAAAVRGQEGDDRLALVKERRASLEREVQRLRGQEKTLLGQLEALDLEVALRTEQAREAQLELQRANAELDGTVARAAALETEVARLRPQLRERARALYKLGELSYVRLLLSVEDASDLFRGYRFVERLARQDRDRVAAFRASLQELRATRERLEQRTREALRLRGELDRARRQLDQDRVRKTEMLTGLVAKKETQAALLTELQDAEQRLAQLVAGLPGGSVAVPIAALRGTLPWPVKGRVRVGFGRQKDPRFETVTLHNGLDVAAPPGTPVFAIHEGTVVYADRFRGYGNMVVIDHGGKHHTLYGHLGDVQVKAGQQVAAGQLVGNVGTSALGGPGLYFEMRFQGKPEDPEPWLQPAR